MVPEIRRSITRMQGSERAQYALALGHELAIRDDFPIAEPTMEAPDLIAIVDADRDGAIDRFATFLGRNPRVIRTLDPESIRSILLPVIRSREADVQGTDLPDDAPYSHELATALQSLVPAISFKALGRTAAAPFVASGRGVASASMFLFSLPRRLWSAFIRFAKSLGNVTIAIARILGKAIAAPFVGLYKVLVWTLAAIGRGVTALGNGTIALIMAIARAIAASARFFANAITNGTRAVGRAMGSAARFTGKTTVVGARFARTTTAAGVRFAGRKTAAGARFAGSTTLAGARFAGSTILAGARFAGSGIATGSRYGRNGFATAARLALRIPAALWKALSVAALALWRPLVAFGSFAATVPARIASSTRRAVSGPVASAGRKTAAASKGVVAAASGAAVVATASSARALSATRNGLAIASHSAGDAAKKGLPWAPVFGTPLAVVTSGALAAVLFAAIVLPFARSFHVAPSSAPVAAATAPVVAHVPHRIHGRVALKPQPKRIARVKIHRAQPRPVRVAAAPHRPRASHKADGVAWKFDPLANPFTSKHRIVARAPRPRNVRVAQVATARVEPQIVQRARLIVTSYLASLMRGDASTALGHLGLSANAPISNLSEGPVLQRAAGFRIVHATAPNGGTAKIDVEITGPQGRYFGVYTVQANGPAAWITDHTVIPTNAAVAVHR